MVKSSSVEVTKADVLDWTDEASGKESLREGKEVVGEEALGEDVLGEEAPGKGALGGKVPEEESM